MADKIKSFFKKVTSTQLSDLLQLTINKEEEKKVESEQTPPINVKEKILGKK